MQVADVRVAAWYQYCNLDVVGEASEVQAGGVVVIACFLSCSIPPGPHLIIAGLVSAWTLHHGRRLQAPKK